MLPAIWLFGSAASCLAIVRDSCLVTGASQSSSTHFLTAGPEDQQSLYMGCVPKQNKTTIIVGGQPL